MDIKSFLAGALCGAAALCVVLWLLRDDVGQMATETDTNRKSPGPTVATTVADRPDRDSKKSAENHSRETNRDVRYPEAPVQAEPPDVPIDAITSNPSSRDNPPVPLSDVHKKLLADQGKRARSPGGIPDSHAALEAEPKDDSWAYYMEQTLLQHLAGTPGIEQFEISNIECRATMCEIQAIGFDESTGLVWAQILQSMRNQPWYEFVQTGSSSGSVGGRLAIISIMHTTPDGG